MSGSLTWAAVLHQINKPLGQAQRRPPEPAGVKKPPTARPMPPPTVEKDPSPRAERPPTADRVCLRGMAQTVPCPRHPCSLGNILSIHPFFKPRCLQSSGLGLQTSARSWVCVLQAGGLDCCHHIDAIPMAPALASGSPFPVAYSLCCPGLIKTFYALGPLRVTRDDFQGLENNI